MITCDVCTGKVADNDYIVVEAIGDSELAFEIIPKVFSENYFAPEAGAKVYLNHICKNCVKEALIKKYNDNDKEAN